MNWIKYDEFIEANRFIINKYESYEDDNQSNNLIEILNNIELEKSDLNNIKLGQANKEIMLENSSENEEYNNMSDEEILSDEDDNILKLINNLSIDDDISNKKNNQENKINNNEISDKNEDKNNYYKKPLRERIKDKINEAKPKKRKKPKKEDMIIQKRIMKQIIMIK